MPAEPLTFLALCTGCRAATWPASQPCPRCVRERARLAAEAKGEPRGPAKVV